MKSRIEIEQRLHNENDVFVIEVLRWVLDGGCPMCEHPDRLDMERDIIAGAITPDYLEARHGWPEGTVMTHMEAHVEFDPREAVRVDGERRQAVNTLDTAEEIVTRILGYLDELDVQKDQIGMTSEFVTDVTRLIGQANTSLKLVGQLKKEIGVDSQILLAQAHMNNMSHILVDALKNHPELLDEVELRMQALRAPVTDVEFEEKE